MYSSGMCIFMGALSPLINTGIRCKIMWKQSMVTISYINGFVKGDGNFEETMRDVQSNNVLLKQWIWARPAGQVRVKVPWNEMKRLSRQEQPKRQDLTLGSVTKAKLVGVDVLWL